MNLYAYKFHMCLEMTLVLALVVSVFIIDKPLPMELKHPKNERPSVVLVACEGCTERAREVKEMTLVEASLGAVA